MSKRKIKKQKAETRKNRVGDLAVYQRTVHALHDLCFEDALRPPIACIREMIVGSDVCFRRELRHQGQATLPSNLPVPPCFNDSQMHAASLALSEPLSIVQGAPGTGKTGLAAFILKCWEVVFSDVLGLLATSFTNTAVDNIAMGLKEKKQLNVIRAGHTSKMCRELHWNALAPGSEGLQQMRSPHVLCATALSDMCGPLDRLWPLVLVDETALATEPSTLVPLCRGAKMVVLVGDHQQMPPMVSQAGCAAGLHVSMFERLLNAGAPQTFLNTQYRMHPSLSHFPMQFYSQALHNGLSTLSRKNPSGYPWPNRDIPICVLHVAEPEVADGSSLRNAGEAEMVRVLIRELQANGVPLNKKSIAVITTYSGQEVFTRSVTDKKVDVYTIDKSQGQERDIIILSMVRSNSEGKLGFICDRRRINVALTRARNGLIIVCNTHTLAADKRTWAYYLDWAKEHHLVREPGNCYMTEDL